LSNAGVAGIAFGGEMLVAGLVAQVFAVTYSVQWGGLGSLQPSPAEKASKRVLSPAPARSYPFC